jgi:hypothetical protein
MITQGYLARHFQGRSGMRDPALLDVAQDYTLKYLHDRAPKRGARRSHRRTFVSTFPQIAHLRSSMKALALPLPHARSQAPHLCLCQSFT